MVWYLIKHRDNFTFTLFYLHTARTTRCDPKPHIHFHYSILILHSRLVFEYYIYFITAWHQKVARLVNSESERVWKESTVA
jgi:hypothetical protein